MVFYVRKGNKNNEKRDYYYMYVCKAKVVAIEAGVLKNEKTLRDVTESRLFCTSRQSRELSKRIMTSLRADRVYLSTTAINHKQGKWKFTWSWLLG